MQSCGSHCEPGGCSSTSAPSTTSRKQAAGSWGAQLLDNRGQRPNCMKCKQEQAVVTVRQKEPLCRNCLETGVMAKVRSAVKSKSVIQPGDKVMVAVSGGCCSLVLLHLLMHLQNQNKQRLERGKVVFDIMAVHVDEGSALAPGASSCTNSEQEALQTYTGDVEAAVRSAGLLEGLSVVQLWDVFESEGVEQRRTQLRALLQAIPDVTGAEDAVCSLRHKLIQDHAIRSGCNKVAYGDCASTMAIRVVSDLSKGRGYSIPADIQLVDARFGAGQPTRIYPMREVSCKELAVMARFQRIQTVSRPSLPTHSLSSINQLVEGFVENLQAQVPHTIYTVVRAAGHMKSFPFNKLPTYHKHQNGSHGRPPPTPTTTAAATLAAAAAAAGGNIDKAAAAHESLPSGVTGELNGDTDTAADSQSLCFICDAPLSSRDLAESAGSTPRPACYSCRNQILSSTSSSSTRAAAHSSQIQQLLKQVKGADKYQDTDW